MSEEQTITVNGWFGDDKQMTKEEFTKVWREHAGELLRINHGDAWTREVTAIAKKVIEQCEKEFDRMYIIQNKDK